LINKISKKRYLFVGLPLRGVWFFNPKRGHSTSRVQETFPENIVEIG